MENSSLTRGRFKFSLGATRHRSRLMERVLYVLEQLGPQQRVAPETQLKSASPSVTTETRYTNNGLDTPCQTGACPSSNRSVDINMGVSRALAG